MIDKFLRFGATAILGAIIMPLIVWGSSTLIEHEKEIARIEIRNKTTKEILLELKTDIKEIRFHIIEKR